MKQDNKEYKLSAAVRKAHRFHQQGNLAKAENEYKKALQIQPDFFDALQGMGAIYLQKKSYPAAIKYLESALRIEPNIPDVLCNCGLAYQQTGNAAKAKEKYQQAITIDPSFGAAHFNLGLLYLGEKNYADALTAFVNSEQSRPGHLATLSNLAFVLSCLGRSAEAIGYYNSALKIEPDNEKLLFELGNSYLANRQHQQAVSCYKQSLAIDDRQYDVSAKLADVLEGMNQGDEANRFARAALELSPGHKLASLVLARIERQQNRPQAVVDGLSGLSSGSTDIDAGIQAELGMAYDRLGRYDDAYQAFQRSNDILGASPEARDIDPTLAYTVIHDYEKWLGHKQRINYPAPIADGLQCPVFLLGFPRSGTTLTEQILAASPLISTGDELDVMHSLSRRMGAILQRDIVYPDCLDDLSAVDIQCLRASYWQEVTRLNGQQAEGKVYIDKMPLNILHLPLIERLFPQSKIIVALRDPRDVCLSCFMQFFQLNESMVQFLSLHDSVKYYAAVMGFWLQYRQKTSLQWLESRYEDLVNDFEPSAKRLYDFLGLDFSPDVHQFHKQAAQRVISTPSYKDVSTPIYTRARGRWLHYRHYLEAHSGALEPYLQQFSYDTD